MSSRRICRWFQFRLRTVFLLTAVLGIWLGIQVKWVRERQEARKWIATHETEGKWSLVDVSDPSVRFSRTEWKNGRRVPVSVNLSDAPWSVRILGEKRLNFIYLDKSKLSSEDVDYINSLPSLFPEAEQIQVTEPEWTTCWPPEDIDRFFQ